MGTMCLQAAKARAISRPDEVAAAVGETMQQQALQQQARGSPGQEITEEQAENSFIFALVSLCYHRINAESIARLESGYPLLRPDEDTIFTQSRTEAPPRPSRQEFMLL